jgi:hypothetical protein
MYGQRLGRCKIDLSVEDEVILREKRMNPLEGSEGNE